MEALSALAVVAQKAIPPAGQKAIPTALLVADLERTRLDFERSRMAAEDRSVRYARSRAMEIDLHRAIERNWENELDERLDERDAALEERDARAESAATSHRIMMRAIDERTEAVYDRTEALQERDALTERLDEAERANASLVRALEEQARSHQRADTEVEARRKRRR